MFEGFRLEHVSLSQAALRVRWGGSGPPIVLLHGHPRTHTTWHAVAPLLAASYTVVCPDLRGYGQSSKPLTLPDHSQMAKRALAADIVELMAVLGYPQFAIAGHDRGSYVAYRAALDHPDLVTRLVVMDGVPIGEALRRADARFAERWWHWFAFGQTANPIERWIDLDPVAWYGGDAETLGSENFADFQRATRDPATVHAMLEDYRAGLGVDRQADDEDTAAGRRIACPVLFMWAKRDDMELLYGDPAAIWRDWADDVQSVAIDSGHHMAEEAPQQVAAEVGRFLGG